MGRILASKNSEDFSDLFWAGVGVGVAFGSIQVLVIFPSVIWAVKGSQLNSGAIVGVGVAKVALSEAF